MRLAMLRRRVVLATVAAGLVASTGCFGPFRLTQKLYTVNKGVSSQRFVPEIIFYLLIPVYGGALVVDGIFANTIEFWTGSNPFSSSRVVRADGTTLIQRGVTTSDGKTLTIDEVKGGETVATTTIHVPHDWNTARLATRYKDGRVVTKTYVLGADGNITLQE
ncbi:DUF3332 family protein [Pseudogemmatithrix spongiicola]|uniref:DUF3332 family protein n=1 Tax=Pseudogemmatithrix spongiicola TaxID=3062599 RepID=A0AA49JZK2_9BACT|nr:DUF3332 family protein [Gemmatimonadaceae bacterium 'strain 138']WKW14764.1 DUF3332 family protein [Gemmatimonadaceae bacterium 'strain 318']